MYRLFAKIVLLGAYVAFAVNLFLSEGWLAAGCIGIFTLGIGCLSFNPKVSINGYALQVLLKFSFILLALPVTLFHLLPDVLYTAGIIHTTPHPWSVFALLYTSAVMVFYVWIPFVCFWILDTAFDWTRKEEMT